MKKELKVGDKVRVEGYGRCVGKLQGTYLALHNSSSGIFIVDKLFKHSNNFQGKHEKGILVVFHRRNIVARIIKKKPREFWINYYDDNGYKYAYSSKEDADILQFDRTGCIHVREVKEKK